ncbi:hypothetical protein B0H17DRAFT_1157745 [Mycena rosella]|uniref:Uncharacterized protein n=1 Tax=Mycena rosella TaxID=1033263 RepID=A0AAD7GQK4_MYCRO|nr:hypothetical protein B0H17DRAFT_1157745 [Mycena rosella]
MPVTLSTPLSLYSIPAVWLTAFLPATMKTMLIEKVKGYNNLEPRPTTSRIATDRAIPPAVAARILRMEGAHLNGYENFPIWIAAVLAGNMAGLDARTLNVVSLLYVAGRITYNFVYFNQATEFQSWVRWAVPFHSTVYPCSLTPLPMYLIFKAAGKMAAAA